PILRICCSNKNLRKRFHSTPLPHWRSDTVLLHRSAAPLSADRTTDLRSRQLSRSLLPALLLYHIPDAGPISRFPHRTSLFLLWQTSPAAPSLVLRFPPVRGI